MTDTEAGTGRRCSCKVGTVAAAYGFEDVDDRLRTRWGDDASVRDLAGGFNRRVLRAAVEASGTVPIDGEIENLYRVLTDDTVDAGSRTRARERLRQDGVPVEDVEDQFVSHQTMYRHLTDCLETEHESGYEAPEERVDAWRGRIRSLRNRTASVTERGVDQLSAADAVAVGSFDVLVDISVLCDDCGGYYDIEEFLDDRACGCTTAGPARDDSP